VPNPTASCRHPPVLCQHLGCVAKPAGRRTRVDCVVPAPGSSKTHEPGAKLLPRGWWRVSRRPPLVPREWQLADRWRSPPDRRWSLTRRVLQLSCRASSCRSWPSYGDAALWALAVSVRQRRPVDLVSPLPVASIQGPEGPSAVGVRRVGRHQPSQGTAGVLPLP